MHDITSFNEEKKGENIVVIVGGKKFATILRCCVLALPSPSGGSANDDLSNPITVSLVPWELVPMIYYHETRTLNVKYAIHLAINRVTPISI